MQLKNKQYLIPRKIHQKIYDNVLQRDGPKGPSFFIVDSVVFQIQSRKVLVSPNLCNFFLKSIEPADKNEVSLDSSHYVDYHIYFLEIFLGIGEQLLLT